MRHPSHRKRARRLLRLLKDLQEDDCVITPPTLISVKHLLQHYNRCKFVEVKIDSLTANCPFDSSRSRLPRFIVSQLKEQKLTDRASERVPVPPVVAFVILSLPSATSCEKLYPTLFRWYYAPRHRTYYVFAYIKHSMARRTYTLTELLGLRTNQVSAEIAAIAQNPDLAEIVRRSGSDVSSAPSRKQVLSRQKDDSSVTSDELLFKGTVSRRMGRELARQSSQHSIRVAARESAREPVHDPSRPMEWKYRGRSETETANSEPIPAPTGVSAQRDEGFQRFYKAVVSPTHVRVTAGGRIVPNTRGPPSPTSKRTQDTSLADSLNMSERAPSSKPAAAAPVGLQPLPVLPQLVSAYPPGLQPIQAPVSFVPMALGAHLPPGFSFAQPAVNPAVVAPLTAEHALKDVHNTRAPDVHNDGYVSDSKPGKDKALFPEVVDYTKPYYYNGQVIYPVGAFPSPVGNPIVPIHMVGIPHGLPPQLPGHYVQPQPGPAVASAATGQSYTSPSQSLSGVPHVVNHIVPANANFNAGRAPPISSIKLSDITKKQIASFKQSLKYHEDQLQYNRHQIDEKEMEGKIQTIKGHIQRFEATLQAQLEYEEAHRKASQEKEDKKPSQPAAAIEGNMAPPQPAGPKETDEAMRRSTSLASYNGVGASTGDSAATMFRVQAAPAFPGLSGLSNGAGLPSEAALAPVFQPRSYASTWTGSKYAREMKAYEEAQKRLLASQSQSLEQRRASDQWSVSQPFAASTPHAEGSNQNDVDRTTPDGNNDDGAGGGKQPTRFGVPYLLGTLPKGVNPLTARDQDYVYKRPLTEEERRARFLYWGKAPKSAVKGLPKFDGKHFYPPSPVKETSMEPAQEIEHRQTSSSGDPFRPMTPVQRDAAEPTAASASEHDCTAGGLPRTISFETQVNSGAEDVGVARELVRTQEGSADAHSIGSAERRSENPGAKLWQAVLRKGPTSSALSSTTAQGLLPQYTGNAAASLSPSLTTNQVPPPRDVNQGKFSDVHDVGSSGGGGVLLSAVPEKRGENCPPNGVNSLEDQFKNLSVDVSSRRNLASAFSM